MTIHLTEEQALEQYDDYLREVYLPVIYVCDRPLDPVFVLKTMDEPAYREGFNNWLYNEDINIDDEVNEEPEETDE